jgi:NAD(P)-dependent dehydrogenase (short-subunit alcohol dehydrogenase family)
LAIAQGGTAEPAVVNLTSLQSVQQFCAELLEKHGRVDAVVHLVGGWRGSATVNEDSIEQFNELLPGIVATVQTTTVAFREALLASPHGRYVVVTSTSVQHPRQQYAAYAAAKAAAEAWVRATGDGFEESPARACIVAVSSLVDQAMRDANPVKTFSSATDTIELGRAIDSLLTDPDLMNGAYVDLTIDKS